MCFGPGGIRRRFGKARRHVTRGVHMSLNERGGAWSGTGSRDPACCCGYLRSEVGRSVRAPPRSSTENPGLRPAAGQQGGPRGVERAPWISAVLETEVLSTLYRPRKSSGPSTGWICFLRIHYTISSLGSYQESDSPLQDSIIESDPLPGSTKESAQSGINQITPPGTSVTRTAQLQDQLL